jgi:hypothetical protein
MNNPDSPESIAAGHDLFVGQSDTPNRNGSFNLFGNEAVRSETMSRWVLARGGAFVFSPSCSSFKRLASKA